MLTYAIYHSSPCQRLSMGIKIGSFESLKMGVGVSFTSNSLAHSENSYVLVKFNL